MRANLALLGVICAGLMLVVGLNSVSADIYEDVVARDGLASFDWPVLDAAVAARTPERSELATRFTDLGGKVVMPLFAAAAAIAISLWRRRFTAVVLMSIAGLGSLLLTVTGKELTDRARPPRSLAVPPFESSPSFPSGHALNATVIVGLVAYLLWISIPSVLARLGIVVLAGSFVAGMGLSRVFLGHHWLTDVAAGWALGLSWLAAVITGHQVKRNLSARQQRAAGVTAKPSAP